MGSVYHVEFDEESDFQATIDPDLGCPVVIPSKAPVNVCVQINGLSEADSPKWEGLPANWPRNVYPVACQGGTFKFMYAHDGDDVLVRKCGGKIPADLQDLKFQTVDAEIHGYPLVPAFALTAHGVQGLTLDNVYVTKLSSRCRQSLYVALSRVRTSAGLTTKERLTDEVLKRFKPKDMTLEGQADLEERARQTTAWLHKLERLVREAFDCMNDSE